MWFLLNKNSNDSNNTNSNSNDNVDKDDANLSATLELTHLPRMAVDFRQPSGIHTNLPGMRMRRRDNILTHPRETCLFDFHVHFLRGMYHSTTTEPSIKISLI